MSEIKNGRLGFCGAKYSKCNHYVMLIRSYSFISKKLTKRNFAMEKNNKVTVRGLEKVNVICVNDKIPEFVGVQLL